MATLDITESKTLLEFLLDLLNDKDALADFRDNPHEALEHAGLGDCTVEDIKELLPVVLEKVDAEKCAQYEDDCDDDHCYDSEPKHEDDDHHCKPVDCDDEGRPAAHCSPTDQVVAHLNYVTNNYNFVDNSHHTYNETNNITKIWAGDDAEIHVDNTTTNVGEGGTYVGGDNNAPITHGDGNVVGDDNQVSGQGSTTAFGSGSAVDGDVDAGDHGAIVFGNGAASTIDASTDNSHQDNSVDNSHQDNSTDNSVDSSTDNSHQDNHVDTDTSHSGNTNIEDSGNTDASTTVDVHHNDVDLALL
ncbi:IniB N-terminal domain-containing protein [Actinomycetospora atypica]|uniref:IniB N-terminal domain-containing protein n=1 Tax=Actinomycetospora atypica TaxID=1290095 RepID=A0ABV9YGM5_9PSEU